jgi:triosephosphate isomerase
MAARKALIAGNWKMYGRCNDLDEISGLIREAGAALGRVDVLVCPPALYLQAAKAKVGAAAVLVGAQDCSPVAADAARTGEISAAMLADAGASYVIVGHSERRTLLGETDDIVRQKAEAARAAGLSPIVCVGETQAQRDEGRAAAVVTAQVAASTPEDPTGLVVAYEPVWAIGGSRTPTLEEIADIHRVVRAELTRRYGAAGDAVRILYGGSVNAKNAGEILAIDGVDGALVGRACLKAADFSAIVRAAPGAS